MKQFIIKITLISLIYFYISNLKIIQNNYIIGIILSVIITELLITNTNIHKLVGGNKDVLCEYNNINCCNNNEFCNIICKNADDSCNCKELCCKTCYLTGGNKIENNLHLKNNINYL